MNKRTLLVGARRVGHGRLSAIAAAPLLLCAAGGCGSGSTTTETGTTTEITTETGGTGGTGPAGGGETGGTGTLAAGGTGSDACVPVPETCNGQDDDCDGLVDEGLLEQSYFKDDDGDGYGTQATVQACAEPPGYAAESGDCNDNNPSIHPDGVEVCNDADDDCNGFNDEGVQKPTFFKDNDGDGYGGVSSVLACSAPPGYVADSGDCNDFNASIHPFATESCNDLDDDCNGLADDGVLTQTIYKDNDGDGIVAANAAQQQKCNVPVGWALAQDVNGDGTDDWDCNDSDETVFPGAPTLCDGKDNNCDGVVDRLCFSACPGSWTAPQPQPDVTAGSVRHARMVDLDGDGNQEILFQSDSAFAVVDATGAILYQEHGNHDPPNVPQGVVLNWSRGQALVADIDTYDKYSPSVQTLEILTANRSKLRYYKLDNGTVTKIQSNHDVYDSSPLMARDMDGDGVVELFTTSWCKPNQGTRVFRYDRNTGTMNNVVDIADPDGACELADGRTLTDLDGDGTPELVFSNGYAWSPDPSLWQGNVYVRKFTSLATLSNDAYCAPGACFPTAVPDLFGGGIGPDLYRIGSEIRLRANYFTDDVPGAPGASRFWTYDLTGAPDANSPSSVINTMWIDNTDIDADGVPESSRDVAYTGLFDVNGDGKPDRITSSGPELQVQLWDPATKTFVTNQGSSKAISGSDVTVGSVWDIDGSGRLAVISTDTSHNLYCHQLGPKTWQKSDILPPHFPTYQRTYQWDNYEPNDGQDTNGDGMPDAIIRVPSALTSKGDFYGYISTPTDKDYYLIDGAYSGPICMTSPKTAAFTMKVFSFSDKLAPAGPDGLVWQDASTTTKKCFFPGNVNPPRHAEYRFIVGIESQGTASPFWPYWIKAAK